jgi:flagellar biosynthesis/type III secretory pathway protein FliH
MLDDLLRETPMYQRILRQGLKEGHEKGHEEGFKVGRKEGIREGLAEGIKEGTLLSLQQTIVELFEERFPQLSMLAKKQVTRIEDPQILRRFIVKIVLAQTAEQAEQLLLTLGADG